MAQSNGMGLEGPTTGDLPMGTQRQTRNERLKREIKRGAQASGLSAKSGGKDGMVSVTI